MKISLKNVGYEYPTFENNKNGIYDVSLEIDSHKRIAIVGHTGSGKSTLLKLIKGLLKKQTGEINIDGKIEDIGYIFQYPEHQIFETTIFKDMSYGLKKLKLNEKEILERVEKVLELVGLDKDYLHHSTLNLSGGEKRRVALAGVLIMQPQLLLLDEATVGLDPEGKEQLFKILLDWQKKENKSFLFITHDMNDVLEYAEEVIVMDKGKLLYHTSPFELFEKHSDKLESLGLELPECISFLNKLNQKLKLNETEIFERVEKVLELVGLNKDYLHHSTLNLSGGEKRRVALAGVLIMQPQLLLLDEATVGLDPEGKEQLFKILLDWQKEGNKSFLFITHDMNDVLEYAEEVIVMDKGKLLYHTSPFDLFEKYSDKLEDLGLELPECISFLNKLNQKLKNPIKISGDIKEESILKVIEEKIK